jgi:amino acid transporter
MVLASASSSTQTTILPTARTVLSMSVHKALPEAFSKVHKRYLTPSLATITFGVVSAVLYIILNFISAGHVIADSVDALGVMIAFYYGLTGFSCFWYYRKQLTKSVHNFFVQGVAPLLGGLILWSILVWSFWYYWNPDNSYTVWRVFGRNIGGTFTIDVGGLLLGIVLMIAMNLYRPAFFRGETLNRDTPTLVTEEFLAHGSAD